jgi:hypothetical protein
MTSTTCVRNKSYSILPVSHKFQIQLFPPCCHHILSNTDYVRCKSMLHVQSFDFFISETKSRHAAISNYAMMLTHKLISQPTLINSTMPTQITSRSVNGEYSKHINFMHSVLASTEKPQMCHFSPRNNSVQYSTLPFRVLYLLQFNSFSTASQKHYCREPQ